MTHEKRCPCGSSNDFASCCEPIIRGRQNAATAEQLMRSRYSAYTIKDSAYLLDSWAEETRPGQLDLDTDPISWVGLSIEACEDGSEEDSAGTVTFTARFLSSGHLCLLHEESRFIKAENRWYYVDGKTHSSTTKMGRNEPCPCGSGKKYKKCCNR